MGDLARLRELEEALWRPETRFDPEFMDAVLAPGFIEFGQSGTRWSREDVIDTAAYPFEATITDYRVRMVTPDVAIATYRADTADTSSHRGSVWRRTGNRWLLEYHQGTPIASGG